MSCFQISPCACEGLFLRAEVGKQHIPPGPGQIRGRAAFGEGLLLTSSVSTAKDFTASLGTLVAFFAKVLFLMTFLVLIVRDTWK